MEWRLDVEIASRSIVTEQTPVPMFMVRIDFTDEDHSSVHSQLSQESSIFTQLSKGNRNNAPLSTKTDSLHFEVDYANMKNLQRELQGALDQLNSAHCQRFSKYIS